MERKLRSLFDYQRFEGNARLAKVIGDVEAKYYGANPTAFHGERLTDDELDLVNAAGDLTAIAEDSRKGDLL